MQRRNTKYMFGLSIQGTHVDIWAASKLLLPSGPGDQPCLRKPGGMAQSDTQLYCVREGCAARAAQRLTYWVRATVPHTTWRADTMASCAAGATAMQDGAAQRLTYWVRPTVPHTTGQADTMASYAAGATAMQDEVCSTLPTG